MTTVPTTRTFVAGEVVLASYFNTNIRDVCNYLLAPPILELQQTSAQTLTTSTFTDILFDTEYVDSSGMHSTVTNTARATAVYPGYYGAAGAISFDTSGTGFRVTRWAVNGTLINASGIYAPPVSGNFTIVVLRSLNQFLNVGDYLTATGWQNTGGNLATKVIDITQSSMSLHWRSN